MFYKKRLGGLVNLYDGVGGKGSRIYRWRQSIFTRLKVYIYSLSLLFLYDNQALYFLFYFLSALRLLFDNIGGLSLLFNLYGSFDLVKL